MPRLKPFVVNMELEYKRPCLNICPGSLWKQYFEFELWLNNTGVWEKEVHTIAIDSMLWVPTSLHEIKKYICKKGSRLSEWWKIINWVPKINLAHGINNMSSDYRLMNVAALLRVNTTLQMNIREDSLMQFVTSRNISPYWLDICVSNFR